MELFAGNNHLYVNNQFLNEFDKYFQHVNLIDKYLKYVIINVINQLVIEHNASVMKIIKNIDVHDIDMPFEGYTYHLPQSQAVNVPEDLATFLEDRLPLSFNFGAKQQKEKAVDVEKIKTKSFLPTPEDASELGTSDMKIRSTKQTPTFGNPDDTPPDGAIDKDGISWYGEGIQVEGE